MLRCDVVIPVYRGVELTRACVESVLLHSGEALGRVLLVNDCGPDEGMGIPTIPIKIKIFVKVVRKSVASLCDLKKRKAKLFPNSENFSVL